MHSPRANSHSPSWKMSKIFIVDMAFISLCSITNGTSHEQIQIKYWKQNIYCVWPNLPMSLFPWLPKSIFLGGAILLVSGETWGVLTFVKLSHYGEKKLLKVLEFLLSISVISSKTLCAVELLAWVYFHSRVITKSRLLQQVAKKINCLDFMKTCIVFIWLKILLPLKTFYTFNGFISSTIERTKMVLSSCHRVLRLFCPTNCVVQSVKNR